MAHVKGLPCVSAELQEIVPTSFVPFPESRPPRAL